jgi:alpha-tubulin suppressor-like RCC1 family protein
MLTGQVMCWGNNSDGQLGDDTTSDRSTPVVATLLEDIASVDAGQGQNCGLTPDGLVSCLVAQIVETIGGFVPVTGADPEPSREVQANRFGQEVVAINRAGNPVTFDGEDVALISQVSGAVQADSGAGHVCSLLGSGAVNCWGANNFGQLGNNASASSDDPVTVVNLSGAADMGVGENHACVIVPTDALGLSVQIACWGLNTNGQLGNGSTSNSRVPVWVIE